MRSPIPFPFPEETSPKPLFRQRGYSSTGTHSRSINTVATMLSSTQWVGFEFLDRTRGESPLHRLRSYLFCGSRIRTSWVFPAPTVGWTADFSQQRQDLLLGILIDRSGNDEVIACSQRHWFDALSHQLDHRAPFHRVLALTLRLQH